VNECLNALFVINGLGCYWCSGCAVVWPMVWDGLWRVVRILCGRSRWTSAKYCVSVIFSARATCAIARYTLSPVRLSVRPFVRLSVTRVDQSKTVEVRIVQASPQSSPMTLVFWRLTSPGNSKGNTGSVAGGAE